MSELVLSIIFATLLVPGIFFTFIPFVPALSYMLVMSLVYGVVDGFIRITPYEFAVLAGITILSVIVDWGAGALGARYGGARMKSIAWGMFGSIAGTFIFPPLGGLLGLFIAVFASEIYYHPTRSKDMAVTSAGGALIGTAVGMAVNAILSVIFFACFVLFLVF
jgi:uncharacterized protein YqgC (DUF456 family)